MLCADSLGVPAGDFNGRMVQYLQQITGSVNTSLPGLQAETAIQLGVDSWNNIGEDIGTLHSRSLIFDGSTNYATMPVWSSNGDFATYADITYEGGAGFIENVDNVAEFGRIGAAYYSGVAKNLSMVDNAPMNGQTVTVGNQTRKLLLDSEVTVTGDITFEFDLIRTDWGENSGSSNNLLSGDSGAQFSVRINDTLATNPNRVRLTENGTNLDWDNAMAGIPLGDHCVLRLEGTIGGWELFINNLSFGQIGLPATSYTVQYIGGWLLGAMGPDSALANVTLSGDEGTYFWPLNETSGTAGAGQGTGVSPVNGVWNEAGGKTAIPNNNRLYKLDEGSGTALADSLDGKDAVLQGAPNWG